VSAVLAFLTILAAIAALWLSRQRLTAKPWLEVEPAGRVPDAAVSAWPAAKVGLGVFLAVVGSLFAILISAYSIRMRSADWASLPQMRLLWLNTGVLVVSSVALQSAAIAARRGQVENLGIGLAAGGVSALVFLAGQLLVWRQLAAAGLFAAINPASAFFYLITAIHGLHLAGGLVALGRVMAQAWVLNGNAEKVRLSVDLCALYWHFLLVIWIIVFGIMAFGTWFEWLYAVCFGA